MPVSSNKHVLAALSASALAALVACNSGDSSMAPGGKDVPSIAVGVNPQSTSVPQGGSTQIAATVTKTNFAGAVVLSVTGAPASISVSISQPPITGAIAAGLITLTATSATPPGTYNLTIHAAGGGVSAASTSFVLTVTAVGSYALSAASTGIAIAPGSSGAVQIAITRELFPNLVDLEAVILPSGVTATFAPNPVTGTTATLTLNVAASAALGSHTLAVRGTSAGTPPRSVPFFLTVGPLATFTVSASPIPVILAQGTSQTIALSIARGSALNTGVALAVEGAPQGLTATLNPALVNGSTSTLTLNATANLTARLHVLTLRAGSPGVAEQTLVLPVLVTPP